MCVVGFFSFPSPFGVVVQVCVHEIKEKRQRERNEMGGGMTVYIKSVCVARSVAPILYAPKVLLTPPAVAVL